MKVNDLHTQLGVTNKEIIDFLKSRDFKVTSHMQNITDEMVDLATTYFNSLNSKKEEVKPQEEEKVVVKKSIPEPIETKKFEATDLIPCKSVSPFKLNAIGVDRVTVYHWNYYGDEDYVAYRDLQAMRRNEIITKPKIIIEDPDLCYQWRRELGDTYKYFLDVDYPEDFFEKTDSDFMEMLAKAPDVLKNVIKITAINMIRNENYPTVQKLTIIDDTLGTCLKDFL